MILISVSGIAAADKVNVMLKIYVFAERDFKAMIVLKVCFSLYYNLINVQ